MPRESFYRRDSRCWEVLKEAAHSSEGPVQRMLQFLAGLPGTWVTGVAGLRKTDRSSVSLGRS